MLRTTIWSLQCSRQSLFVVANFTAAWRTKPTILNCRPQFLVPLLSARMLQALTLLLIHARHTPSEVNAQSDGIRMTRRNWILPSVSFNIGGQYQLRESGKTTSYVGAAWVSYILLRVPQRQPALLEAALANSLRNVRVQARTV